ncbi:hypothetical protein [Sulfurimonas sp. C5]|uniref:hypothetical protein n=1 Tax=Sulfurimonas sp. C5 TaxID=3036947 RepID=UPI00245601CA|nr:hypothetical protein [Sulfurimonas sp. C5]MDH4944935.1 hypothetical protein [Sulfurimonas sp. C5]
MSFANDVSNPKKENVPGYMYDIFTCTHIDGITLKNDKVVDITQDKHWDIFKLTITPKYFKWRELEEFTDNIDKSNSHFEKYYTRFETLDRKYTHTFTMYKYKNQGLYSMISKFNGELFINTYDCIKSTEFQQQDKQDWYDSDKR